MIDDELKSIAGKATDQIKLLCPNLTDIDVGNIYGIILGNVLVPINNTVQELESQIKILDGSDCIN